MFDNLLFRNVHLHRFFLYNKGTHNPFSSYFRRRYLPLPTYLLIPRNFQIPHLKSTEILLLFVLQQSVQNPVQHYCFLSQYKIKKSLSTTSNNFLLDILITLYKLNILWRTISIPYLLHCSRSQHFPLCCSMLIMADAVCQH